MHCSAPVRFVVCSADAGKPHIGFPSLMGPKVKVVLARFEPSRCIVPVSAGVYLATAAKRGEWLDALWRQRITIDMSLNKDPPHHMDAKMAREACTNWVRVMFRRLRTGESEYSATRGYARDRVTPYMHTFAQHIPEFTERLHSCSCQDIERENWHDIRRHNQASHRRAGGCKDLLLTSLRLLLNPDRSARAPTLSCDICGQEYVYAGSLAAHHVRAHENMEG